MGESLTMRRCVQDEGLRVVNCCWEGKGRGPQQGLPQGEGFRYHQLVGGVTAYRGDDG